MNYEGQIYKIIVQLSCKTYSSNISVFCEWWLESTLYESFVTFSFGICKKTKLTVIYKLTNKKMPENNKKSARVIWRNVTWLNTRLSAPTEAMRGVASGKRPQPLRVNRVLAVLQFSPAVPATVLLGDAIFVIAPNVHCRESEHHQYGAAAHQGEDHDTLLLKLQKRERERENRIDLQGGFSPLHH